MAEAWNGSAWSTQQTPAIARGHNLGGSLAGVSCASPTTCIAVGSIVTQVPNENQFGIRSLNGCHSARIRLSQRPSELCQPSAVEAAGDGSSRPGRVSGG